MLDQQTKDELRDFIELSRQSGKMETSGLVHEILKQMDQHIELSVKKHVNGNISNIKKQIDDLTVELQPVINIYTSVAGFDRVGIWILKFLAMVGAAIGGFWALIELFKKIIK